MRLAEIHLESLPYFNPQLMLQCESRTVVTVFKNIS